MEMFKVEIFLIINTLSDWFIVSYFNLKCLMAFCYNYSRVPSDILKQSNQLTINELNGKRIKKTTIQNKIYTIADTNVSDTSLSQTRMSATLRYRRHECKRHFVITDTNVSDTSLS